MWLRLFLHWMKSANQEEIDRILDEAIKRRKELFPGWDIWMGYDVHSASKGRSGRKKKNIGIYLIHRRKAEINMDYCIQ